MPLVEDTKNALLLHFDRSLNLSTEQMATLQHALTRAIETEHVLETGELLGEPMPTRDSRNAILFYEASEGGAGVLKRLMEGHEHWKALARKALELMHFDIAAGEVVEKTDACVTGCYRCLLSYYNQPDHELIDRQDDEVISILLRLAACREDTPAETGDRESADYQESDLDAWPQAFAQWEWPLPLRVDPDGALVWAARMVLATTGPASQDRRAWCENAGFILVELPIDPGASKPVELAEALGIEQ